MPELRRVLHAGGIFLLFSAALAAVEVAAQSTGSGAEIRFFEVVYDFGKLLQGDVVRHEFRFKNVGDRPLEIIELKSSCGCTAAASRLKSIPPGAEGAVELSFNSADRRGPIEKSIIVRSNSAMSPEVTLTVRSVIITDVEFDPPLLLLGRVERGSTIEREVRIVNATNSAVTITELQPAAGMPIRIQGPKTPFSLPPGDAAELKLIIEIPKTGESAPAGVVKAKVAAAGDAAAPSEDYRLKSDYYERRSAREYFLKIIGETPRFRGVVAPQ